MVLPLLVSAIAVTVLLPSCADGRKLGGGGTAHSDTETEEPSPVLVLSIEAGSEDYWKRIPPPPLETVRATDAEAVGRLVLERMGPDESEGEDFEETSPDIVRTKVLSRSYYAPAVPIWDERHDISSSELDGLDSDIVRPVQEIEPPMKALSVDGMTVDDPDYPLVEELQLSLRLYSGHPAHSKALKNWFDTSVPAPAERADLRWIGGVGDMMVARGIQDILIAREREDGLTYIFGNTLPVLRRQDLLIGNLEGAVTTSGTRIDKSYNFRFRPEVLPRLKDAGFDYLSVTNNHCYDYGEEGFLDTLENLENYGLSTSGAGRTVEEAYEAEIIELPHTGVTGRMVEDAAKVKILSVGAYPREKNGFDGRSRASVNDTRAGIIFSGPKAIERIGEYSSAESIDIVAVHGGKEWSSTPTDEQKRFYRACAEAGADLVFGSHPHVLQGMEGHAGGLIAYSLGNFLFPGMYVMHNAEDSLILSVGFFEGRPLYVRPYPVRIDNRRILLDESDRILGRFLRLTEELHEER